MRFVSDRPSRGLIDRLAAAYQLSGGDLRELIRTLVRLPEFWSSHAEKIRSPLEMATAALRALDAEVEDTRRLAKAS